MTRALRVALVVPGFSEREDDNCVPALRHFAVALARQHQVTVVALRFPHSDKPYALDGLRVRPLGGADISGLSRLALLWRGYEALREEGPFDVVHGLWADEPGWLAVQFARRRGAAHVVSLMGGELADLPSISYGGRRSFANRQLQRSALRSAHRVTAGSAWLQSVSVKELGRDVSFAPLGLTPPPRASPWPDSSPGTPLSLGWLGSLIDVKGLDVTLQACEIAQRRGVSLSLKVFGDGPNRASLTRRAASLGLDVSWLGEVPWAEVYARLSEVECVIQSSRWESQGMAILEACASGRPVMGSRVGVLEGLKSALGVCPPGSPAALAALIERAAADREALAAAGLRARREVLEAFSLEVAMERWLRVYDEAMQVNARR